MTGDQFRKIDEALTMVGGNRDKASVIIGITRLRLRELIASNEVLRSKWMHKKRPQGIPPDRGIDPIPPEAMINRANPARGLVPVSEGEMALLMHLDAEDLKFRAGMEGLRLTPEEMDMATSLQKFQGKHFAKTVDLITGGMSVTSLRLMTIIERLVARLNGQFADVSNGEITVDALAQEQMCWRAFHKCCDSLMGMAKSATEGAVARAKIELWKKQANEKVKESGKPGFRPRSENQIYVAPGASVAFNTHETPPSPQPAEPLPALPSDAPPNNQ